ncbi:MAG: lipoyl(octanoyl) transferase [Candidatus Schekmanbacteria bacterium RBG_13_48_7]|uniref:Octanoyltransferase n=1 Tax=Candidatus Schekmanbacteria bacterium RBG_13_48_7 TaxID=1817878 RepID=A0A1F7RP14_9BACT|nr:MAG: lipoyl(octanoyl) transferase [Candidatus Schekmanbacteria bacterium RBG_13_48_7]
MPEDARFLWVFDLGRIPFSHAWKLQKELVEKRSCDQIADILLFAEHNDVYTCGKKLLSSGTPLKNLSGIPFHFVERGGSETYHGPGQIIGYPILKLRNEEKNIHRYLRNLEEVLIRTVQDLGLPARRNDGQTGVWVGDKKIASIGIAIKKWVSYHGFALNHSTNLLKFQLIRPCGLNPESISSLRKLLGKPVDREVIINLCLKYFAEIFERYIIPGNEFT